ncbi:MAG TPA: ATP-binding protein, partial [Paracoccaceae bacterium]|nr:ATP-binding protein [Paracoccaceae bacterium]
TRQHIDRVAASADMLANLLDNALDLASIGPPGIAPRPSLVDAGRFLRGLSRMWSSEAERKGVKLVTSFEAAAPEQILVDEMRLQRVIGNLLGNAVKFTDAGMVMLRAGLDEAGLPYFEVEDTGPGLSAEARSRLFEPFGRPEGMSKPGTGLGLYIASTLVEQIGGGIALSDRPGGGCIARVTLPAAVLETGERARAPREAPGAWPAGLRAVEPAPAAVAAPVAGPRPALEAPEESHAGAAASLPDLGRFHVLMAEDNVTNQLVAGQMLQAMRARVTIAADGAEALEKLDSDRFDLLLVDIEMPRVSGLDVIRRVREMPDDRADLLVIALTAYAMREHREKITAAGADGLIAKPILGIREFGEQILAIEARRGRRGRRWPGDGPRAARAPGEAEASPIRQEIYEALAGAIGPEGMSELLGKVEEDLLSVGARIAGAIEKRDFATLRAQSHILISVAGAVGALPLQQEAEALNGAARREEAAALARMGPQVADGIRRVVAFVSERRGSV